MITKFNPLEIVYILNEYVYSDETDYTQTYWRVDKCIITNINIDEHGTTYYVKDIVKDFEWDEDIPEKYMFKTAKEATNELIKKLDL